MNELIPKNNSLQTGVEQNSSHISLQNKKDNNFLYFSERAKKITTAVYLVTNILPQTDPLRFSIRRSSVRILSLISTGNSAGSPAQVSGEISDLAKKMSSMLEVAFFSGYISEMNFSVLKSELDIFANEISAYDSQKTISRDLLMPAEYSLSASNSGHSSITKLHGNNDFYKGQKPVLNKKPARPRSESTKTPSQRGVAETKKNSRKESIISIIKMKGSVGIKDVSSVIINCSEKTIQRELTALVADGTLKRTGDRRWSTYSIAA